MGSRHRAAHDFLALQWEMERLNRDYALETDIGRIELGHQMDEVRKQMKHCRVALRLPERATKMGLGVVLTEREV